MTILVHGRNATAQSILDLVPYLNRPGFAYLAPAAASNTWYPYSFMAETGKNEPDLTSALLVLEELVASVLAWGFDHRHIALVGFSQGACLAGEFAVRHAARYGGIILYSGGLIGPPGTTWNYPGSFAGAPVFLGCSDVDPHVPKARVDESAAVFERMGAAVVERIYPGMGHVVDDDEIDVARRVMDGILAVPKA